MAASTSHEEVIMNRLPNLSDTELWTIINALGIAAEQWTADAKDERINERLQGVCKVSADIAMSLANRLPEESVEA